MSDIARSMLDAIAGIDSLAALFLAGSLFFLWLTWKVLKDDPEDREETRPSDPPPNEPGNEPPPPSRHEAPDGDGAPRSGGRGRRGRAA